MDFSKIIPAIATVAPTIAGLLGGPLASMGVQAIEGVFGLAPGTAASNPAALQTAVANMTPDTAVKLAQIDADLKAKLMQGGIDLAKLGMDDTANARAREIAVKDRMPMVLGAVTVAAALGLVFTIVTGYAPALKDPTLAGTVGVAIGFIFSEAKQVYSYYFGSSLGSANKDTTIATLSAS
jgi:hypothetical protein